MVRAAPFPAFDPAHNKGVYRPKVCNGHSHGANMNFFRAGRKALSLFPYKLCIERTISQTLNSASDTPFVAFSRIYSTGYKKRKDVQQSKGSLENTSLASI